MDENKLKYQLLYYSLISDGEYYKIAKHVWENTPVKWSIVEDFIKNNNSSFITILDKQYPSSLRKIYHPPYVIYYQGKIELLKTNKVFSLHLTAKQPTLWTKHRIKRKFLTIDEFKSVLVQTINFPYSLYTIETGIKINLDIILVLNTGINKYLLNTNYLNEYIKKHGLIISIYPNNLKSSKSRKLVTNKILAGITDEVFFYELEKNYYNNNLINNFSQINKQVFCMQNLFYPKAYTNNLIKEGAYKFY